MSRSTARIAKKKIGGVWDGWGRGKKSILEASSKSQNKAFTLFHTYISVSLFYKRTEESQRRSRGSLGENWSADSHPLQRRADCRGRSYDGCQCRFSNALGGSCMSACVLLSRRVHMGECLQQPWKRLPELVEHHAPCR